MTRLFTALFAALEALLVVGIGIAIPLLPLTIMWVSQYGLQVDWVVFWRAAVDIWLLGSGVDITMTLNPVLATGLGFSTAGAPFVVSIALLGFGLLTCLLGARAGRRIGEIHFSVLGLVTAVAVFAAASVGVALSALWATARASLVQSAVLPTLVFAFGLAIGVLLSRREVTVSASLVRSAFLRVRPELRAVLAAVARGSIGAVALVVASSAFVLSVLLVADYAKIIALYEAIHAGVLGGISVTLGQLALLPNLVVWTASWLVGPGFAVGTGSAVSPLGTTLGPLPAIPVLGALPGVLSQWSYLGLLIPVLAGFVAAVLIRRRLVAAIASNARALGGDARRHRVGWLFLAGVLVGVVGGVLMGLLAWASGGAAGPGRLMDVGPQPLLVAAWSALEFGLAALIGLFAAKNEQQSS